MRYLIAPVILLVVMTLLFVWLIHSCSSKIEDLIEELRVEYKSCLGDTLVFNNDTLIIIDYNMLNETFTLNNNSELNKDFAKKLIISKKK